MGNGKVSVPVEQPGSYATAPTSKVTTRVAPSATQEAKPKKKIFCSCPDTNMLRDECIVEHGESDWQNGLKAHKKCLRAEGFNV